MNLPFLLVKYALCWWVLYFCISKLLQVFLAITFFLLSNLEFLQGVDEKYFLVILWGSVLLASFAVTLLTVKIIINKKVLRTKKLFIFLTALQVLLGVGVFLSIYVLNERSSGPGYLFYAIASGAAGILPLFYYLRDPAKRFIGH